MSTTWHIHVEAGHYVACVTTTGLDHQRVPRGAFGKPLDAIRYCDMRQAAVSPLRAPGEAGTPSPASPGVLTDAGK